jgi:Rap1a immunity proteins
MALWRSERALSRMGRCFWLVLAANALAIPSACGQPAPADGGAYTYVTGEMLTGWCRSFLVSRRQGTATTSQNYEGNRCYGYVLGVIDAFSPTEGTDALCLPGGLNSLSVTEIVANYLDHHPEMRIEPGYALTWGALAEAYPCSR